MSGQDYGTLTINDFLDTISGTEDEKLAINGDSFQAASETVILLAPASGEAPNNMQELPALGLVQSLNIGTAKGVAEVGEIGTEGTANVPTAVGRRQGTLVKIVTKEASLLHAIYRKELEENPELERPAVTHGQWENLDHPLFKRPVGLILAYLRLDEDQRPVVDQYEWLQGVLLGRVSHARQYGTIAVSDEATISWDKTVPIPVDSISG